MEAKKKAKKVVVEEIPTREQLINEGVDYVVEGKEIYFSVKELESKYKFLKSHEADQKTFQKDNKDFIGVKLSNLFI